MKSQVKNFLISLNKTPVRFFYAVLYELVVAVLVWRLKRIHQITLIALAGSTAQSKPLYFHSDLDLFILVDCLPEERIFILRIIESKMRKCKTFFPFVGSIEERMAGVYFLSDIEKQVHAAPFTYAMKQSTVRQLYRQGNVSLPSVGDDYTHKEVLEELKTIIKLSCLELLKGDATQYFFQRKIEKLISLFTSAHSVALFEDALSADAFLYITRLLSLSPMSAYVSRVQFHELVLLQEIFALCIRKIIERYAFDDLAQEPVKVVGADGGIPCGAASPCFSYLDQRERIDWFSPAEKCGVEDSDFFSLSEFLESSAKVQNAQTNLFFMSRYLAVHVCGTSGCNVFTVYERPELFSQRWVAPDTVLHTRYFHEINRQELDLVISCMKNIYQPVFDMTVRKEQSLGYFLNVERTVCGFFVIHLFYNYCREVKTVFTRIDQVFDDLIRSFPDYRDLFVMLRDYYRMVKDDSTQEEAYRFPPNLMSTARDFFAHYLFERKWAGAENLDKRLSISLCVCTKNRAGYLRELFDSICEQTRQPDELIIIDNMSTDDTLKVVDEYAEQLPIRCVSDDAQSIPALRNRALDEATGEIISFTDDDCVLHKNWLYFVEDSFLRDDTIGAVGGNVHHYSEKEHSAVNYFHQEYLGVKY